MAHWSTGLPPPHRPDRIALYGWQPVRKTFKYKMKPTSTQTAVLEQTLVLCRMRYNCALQQRRQRQQRRTWGRRGHGRAATRAQQEAELPGLRAALPAHAAVHA